MSARPATIADTVSLLNSLPPPVTVECFLESLKRPLLVEATSSSFSLQPAAGDRSPRIFLFSGGLVLSVVPDGKGRDLLELGELRAGSRSIKAEIAFPIDRPLTAEAPFERVWFAEDGSSTSCGFCHAGERPAAAPGSFESQALQPLADTLVPVATLVEEAERCDASAEPERCSFLHALVDHGPLQHQRFPSDFLTFED